MEEFISFFHTNTNKNILNYFEHAYSCIELILTAPHLFTRDILLLKYLSRNFDSHLILSILS